MAQANIWLILQENPIILWGGLILAALIFLIAKHLEGEEEGRDAPEPTTLDKIVKPKVKEHLRNRGKTPASQVYFKIGRDTKGLVSSYVDTKLPKKLINPNPKEKTEDLEQENHVDVRIISVKPARRLERILEKIIEMFTRRNPQRKLYVFQQDSFVDTPNSKEMIVEEDVMSHSYGGMEVELSTASRNTVNQAVQTVVAEKLLASLPNYTEKVDYLFPIHSQKISLEEERAKQQEEW